MTSLLRVLRMLPLVAAMDLYSASGMAQLAGAALPTTLLECDGDSGNCTSWTFSGSEGHGQWATGAIANLSIKQFDDHTVSIQRADTSGVTAGMTALYTGTRTGNAINGSVTWSWPNHGSL